MAVALNEAKVALKMKEEAEAPRKKKKTLQDGKLFSSSFPVWECCDALCFIRKVYIDVFRQFFAIFLRIVFWRFVVSWRFGPLQNP